MLYGPSQYAKDAGKTARFNELGMSGRTIELYGPPLKWIPNEVTFRAEISSGFRGAVAR